MPAIKEQTEQSDKLIKAYHAAITSEEIMTAGFALLAFLGENAKRTIFHEDVTDKAEFISAGEMLITTFQKLPNLLHTLCTVFPIFLGKRHLGLEGASDAEAELALKQMMKADGTQVITLPRGHA